MSLDHGGWLGRYRLLERISEGGAGEVWLATVPGSGEPVVVKRLRAHLRENAQLILRLKHEARIAVLITDPHVVRVLDVGEAGGEVYLCMEYVEGWTLARALQAISEPPVFLPATTVRSTMVGILRGLAALHSVVHPETKELLMAVHRDIAPRNVMMTPSGEIKIIDLGLGKSNIQGWTTRIGATIGTPGYMAPERLLGRPCDHRTDIFSAFVLGFELISSERYLPRGPTDEMVERCLADAFRPPSKKRPDLDPRVDELFRKGLALRPDERFASAEEALLAIESLWGPSEAPELAGLPGSLVSESLSAAAKARALAASVAEGPLEDQETTIYARRSDSVTAPLSLVPGSDLPPAPTELRPPSSPSPQVLPRGSAIAKQSTDLTFRRLPIVFLVLLFCGGVVAGIGLSLFLPRPASVPPFSDTTVVSSPQLTPSVIVEPRTEPEASTPGVEVPPDPKPPAPLGRPRPARTRATSSAPPAVEKPPPQVAPVSLQSLIARTVPLRRARPDLAPEIDEFVTDVALWQRAPKDERSSAALAKLQERLRSLEMRP